VEMVREAGGLGVAILFEASPGFGVFHTRSMRRTGSFSSQSSLKRVLVSEPRISACCSFAFDWSQSSLKRVLVSEAWGRSRGQPASGSGSQSSLKRVLVSEQARDSVV